MCQPWLLASVIASTPKNTITPHKQIINSVKLRCKVVMVFSPGSKFAAIV